METFKSIKLIDRLPENKGLLFNVEGQPTMADYSANNLGRFYADTVEFMKASETGAFEGRGYYLRDQTGELWGVFKTQKALRTFIAGQVNEAARGA